MIRPVLPAAAFAVVTLASVRSFAASCSTLPDPKIYIESGDTQEPLIKALGKQLAASSTPITVIYRTNGTCTVRNDMFTPTPFAAAAVVSYTPANLDETMTSPTCTLDAATPIDLGIGATFLESCAQTPAQPAGIAVLPGPIQSYGFVVNPVSLQNAITAEEGYFVFGFGMNGGVTPWNDETKMFVRGSTKSTALTLGAAIGVPGNKFKGVKGTGVNDSSTFVQTGIESNASQATIGLLGTEIYDKSRGTLKLLAFQGRGQTHAYYPDSSATAFDKRNLRDGHYLPWAPTVYITAVDGSSSPTNANVKHFINLVLGKEQTYPGVNGLATTVSKGLVPECAMHVRRDGDGLPVASYCAPEPCDCFFEKTVSNGTTSCTACSTDAQCAPVNGGKCRYGYCEAR